MKEYGRIRYITSYEEAPDKSYILRQMGDLTARLEYYSDHIEILSEFLQGAFFEGNLHSTLLECRQIMGNNKTLHVLRL